MKDCGAIRCGAVLLAVSSSALSCRGLEFSVVPDHADHLYKRGETAKFAVVVTDGGNAATNGTVRAWLDNTGQDVQARQEWNLSETNAFVVAGELAEPGFLTLHLESPGSGESLWSVGFEPESIRKGSSSPEDFDEFWANARRRLAEEVPLDPVVTEVPLWSTEKCSFYRISFATFGRRVHGFMSVPKDSTKGPFPVNFGVNPAGFGWWTNDLEVRDDAVCVQFSVYPFEMDLRWEDLGLKEKFFDPLNAESKRRFGTEYQCGGISLSREDYFYYPVILGIDRAVDWLAARPYVDGRRICYQGTSQGGGIGIALCALNHRFAKAAFYVPALTDLMGYKAGRRSGWPMLVESNSATPEARAAAERNAPYFDAANFASRIACPVRFAVGFSDPTCPPCAVYATYNEIKVKDKEILNGFGMTHSCFGEFYGRLGDWIREAR